MTLRELWLIGRATVRVLADSNRTDEIHLVEEITGRDAYRRYLARWDSDPEIGRLLADRPELRSDQVDYDRLRRLPGDTLGGAYARHLDGCGITADYQAAGTRFVDDDRIAYLMRRFRQTHDIWHTLLGLGIAGHEEVLVHSFSWGQLRLPVSAMVIVGGTIKHIVMERRRNTLQHGLRAAYEMGRAAAPLLPVCWEQQWEQQLDQVRVRYRVQPLPAWVNER